MIDEFLIVVKKLLQRYQTIKLTNDELQLFHEIGDHIDEDYWFEDYELVEFIGVRFECEKWISLSRLSEIILSLIMNRIYINKSQNFDTYHLTTLLNYILTPNSYWLIPFDKIYSESSNFCSLVSSFDSEMKFVSLLFRNRKIFIDNKVLLNQVVIIDDSRFIKVDFNFLGEIFVEKYLYLLGRHTDPSVCKLACDNPGYIYSPIQLTKINLVIECGKLFSKGRAEYFEEKKEYLESCATCLKSLNIFPPGLAEIVSEYSFS
jgi:hypothetical protein